MSPVSGDGCVSAVTCVSTPRCQPVSATAHHTTEPVQYSPARHGTEHGANTPGSERRRRQTDSPLTPPHRASLPAPLTGGRPSHGAPRPAIARGDTTQPSAPAERERHSRPRREYGRDHNTAQPHQARTRRARRSPAPSRSEPRTAAAGSTQQRPVVYEYTRDVYTRRARIRHDTGQQLSLCRTSWPEGRGRRHGRSVWPTNHR